MSELEPPEVPIELSSNLQTPVREEKKGFFQRLFSKKDKSDDLNSPIVMPENSNIPMPELDLQNDSQMNISSVPEFPTNSQEPNPNITVAGNLSESKSVSKSIAKPSSKKGKAKKSSKSHAKNIESVDESSQFDWTREIKDQEILIHDSNRFNDDINSLMKKADDHVTNGMITVDDDSFVTEHQDIYPNLEPISIDMKKLEPLPEFSSQGLMPQVDEETGNLFRKVSSNHGKIRKKLHKYVHSNARPKKNEIKELLNDYDESVEKHIEDKEIELTGKKKSLDKLAENLKSKSEQINDVHEKVTDLHLKLVNKEEDINEVISDTVDKELSRRLKEEREHLRSELKNTVKLNLELRRKSKSIDDDKLKLEKDHQKVLESERKKLNELQTVYEKKLEQLTSEKKKLADERQVFEKQKSDAMKLIEQANIASKELDNINNIKSYIDKNKQRVEKDIVDDKELKKSIEAAEKTLVEEKKNLDNLIFSKYIENKLKSIKPEYLNENQDWKAELNSNPIYKQINECKKLLASKKILDAKNLYSSIRVAYENTNVQRREKEALYVAIRELYNEIQLRMVETQMRTR